MAPEKSSRRRRSHIENDEDADIVRSSQSPSSSSSGKRARLNGYSSDDTPPTDSLELEDGFAIRRAGRRVNGVDDGAGGSGNFQEGSIVRVKLIDFVTYEKAEFFPGPNLNMVIGPNGTGKSSLVCAICLGLGWGPKHLGRAGEIGEFVKHSQPHAIIEIELQGPRGKDNHIVKVKITKDGNGRDWWLNGKKTGLKTIQTLCKSLSIQVDNLCQFLPQDKVSEFAGLSPVELLQQTQRAAAPAKMLVWHDELKSFRKEQKTLEAQVEGNNEMLRGHEVRMANLQAQKEQLEEILAIKKNVKMMQTTIPFLEYRDIRLQGSKLKEKKKEASTRWQQLKRESEPSLAAVTQKKAYKQHIMGALNSRKKKLQEAERESQAAITVIEKLDAEIEDIDHDVEEEKKADKKRVDDVGRLRRKIRDLEAKTREDPPDFNASEWNEKIKVKDHRLRDIKNEVRELDTQQRRLNDRGRDLREQITNAQNAISDSQTQEGLQINKIHAMSPDTAEAWKWIQAHPDEFEQEVYGPAMISCAIRHPKYAAAVESTLDRRAFLAITTQNANDFQKLGKILNGKKEQGGLGLGDVTIRSIERPLSELRNPPVSADEMRKCGLDGWALDFIDGPEPVLAMLCANARVNASGIALRQVTEGQHEMLVRSNCNSWVSGNTSYRVISRREYGPLATSTTTRNLANPKYWTDQPVDNLANREMRAKKDELEQEFNSLKETVRPLKEKMSSLREEYKSVEEEMAELTRAKGEEQKRHGEYMALPSKLEKERVACEKLEQAGLEVNDKIKKKLINQDNAVLRKVKKIILHKKLIEAIRKCQFDLLEAKIRLVEADSDVELLEERNRTVLENIEREAQAVRDTQTQLDEIKDKFKIISVTVADLLAEATAAGNGDYLKKLPDDMTIADQQTRIIAEESKLEFMHANNPNAIRDFELKRAELEKLQEKITGAQDRLESLSSQITEIRTKWEPALDRLIGEISDAFSYNFEQIGCAGEVGIHKDDDFELWAVQIKVKFRQSESLQILDQHRQSGGERSVSTIFYLMALQSLAQSPFRVVDEINQGMDPRNERMVHERMVEIACKEHTSQYFLITPKLLTGLRYDARMRTHVINSGPHVHDKANEIFNVKNQLLRKRAIVAAM